jgi:hypothetical protein
VAAAVEGGHCPEEERSAACKFTSAIGTSAIVITLQWLLHFASLFLHGAASIAHESFRILHKWQETKNCLKQCPIIA